MSFREMVNGLLDYCEKIDFGTWFSSVFNFVQTQISYLISGEIFNQDEATLNQWREIGNIFFALMTGAMIANWWRNRRENGVAERERRALSIRLSAIEQKIEALPNSEQQSESNRTQISEITGLFGKLAHALDAFATHLAPTTPAQPELTVAQQFSLLAMPKGKEWINDESNLGDLITSQSAFSTTRPSSSSS